MLHIIQLKTSIVRIDISLCYPDTLILIYILFTILFPSLDFFLFILHLIFVPSSCITFTSSTSFLSSPSPSFISHFSSFLSSSSLFSSLFIQYYFLLLLLPSFLIPHLPSTPPSFLFLRFNSLFFFIFTLFHPFLSPFLHQSLPSISLILPPSQLFLISSFLVSLLFRLLIPFLSSFPLLLFLLLPASQRSFQPVSVPFYPPLFSSSPPPLVNRLRMVGIHHYDSFLRPLEIGSLAKIKHSRP